MLINTDTLYHAKENFVFLPTHFKERKMQAHILAHLVALPTSDRLATKRAKILLPTYALWIFFCFLTVFLFVDSAAGQIKEPISPNFQQTTNPSGQFPNQQNNASQNNHSEINNTSYNFSPNYVAPSINTEQNTNTQQIIQFYTTLKEINETDSKPTKQPWELKLKDFHFLSRPHRMPHPP